METIEEVEKKRGIAGRGTRIGKGVKRARSCHQRPVSIIFKLRISPQHSTIDLSTSSSTDDAIDPCRSFHGSLSVIFSSFFFFLPPPRYLLTATRSRIFQSFRVISGFYYIIIDRILKKDTCMCVCAFSLEKDKDVDSFPQNRRTWQELIESNAGEIFQRL